MHPACLSDDELLKRCEVNRGRAGGPGGQHRNKVETHITITHTPTGLIGQAGERRSQHENKSVALRRLRLALATEHREPLPRGEIVSVLWRSRVTPGAGAPGAPGVRGELGRIACNPDHHDYPALLAEAMDAVFDAGLEPKAAALRLGVSATQLVRLIGDHPPALVRLNAARAGAGLRALR